MRFTPRRSSPRLPAFAYRGNYAYHVILNAHGGSPSFEDSGLVAFCLERLTASASRHGFEVVAYCFMPAHVHILVVGDHDAPLVRFVQHFKQATGHHSSGLWQRSFYDHIVRREEDLRDVARYIWGNPVRAGVVENMGEYPYSGPREAMAGDEGDVEDRASAMGGPAFGGKALSLRRGLGASLPGLRRRRIRLRRRSLAFGDWWCVGLVPLLLWG